MKKIFSLVLLTLLGSVALATAQSVNYNYSSNQSSSANSNSNTQASLMYNGYGGWGWGGYSWPWNTWNNWDRGNYWNYGNDTAPANCKVWYDGCNTCSRQYPGGPLVCTKLACFAHNQPYCKEYFYTNNNWSPYGWGVWGYPWGGWNYGHHGDGDHDGDDMHH